MIKAGLSFLSSSVDRKLYLIDTVLQLCRNSSYLAARLISKVTSSFMAAVLMLSAGDSGIIEFTREPAFHDIFNAARTAAQNIDPLVVQDVYGPLSHVARYHQLHAHLRQSQGDIRFAAATGGWCDLFLRSVSYTHLTLPTNR